MKQSFLYAALLVLLCNLSTPLMAQNQEEKNDELLKTWSVGVQLVHLYDLPAYRYDQALNRDLWGLNGDKTSFDLGVDVYLEKMFTPLFGLQLGARFGSMTGASEIEYYTNSFYEVQLDGVFVLSNLDAFHINSPWNFYVKAGIGNGAFSTEQFLISDDSPDNEVEDSFWATRFGVGVQYELNSFLRLELEAAYNSVLNDGFDGFNNASGSDSYLATSLGIAYTFGEKEKKPMYAVNYFGGDYLAIGTDPSNNQVVVGATTDTAKLNDFETQLEAQKEALAILEKENAAQRAKLNSLSNAKNKVVEKSETRTEVSLTTGVYFAFDSAVLTNQAKRELVRDLAAVENKQAAKIDIVGYADKNGDETYNKQLKQKRADAVKRFLVQVGFTEANILSNIGETSPLELENQFLNRKVEVQVK